ncbi:MAG: response regulator [Candidatus Promineifilaceae bacterium]
MIKVLLADDHTMFRELLRSLLEEQPGMQVVGEAADGHRAVQLASQEEPDVVVMDILMPRLTGLEATRQIKALRPEIRVIMLTMAEDEEHILQSLRAGAEGYLLKKSASAELVTAIHVTYEGDTYLSPTISRRVVEEYIRRADNDYEPDSLNQLTSREREILQLIAEGRTSKEIGDLLVISDRTVHSHRRKLMEKLGLHSIAELTLYAVKKGLVSIEG